MRFAVIATAAAAAFAVLLAAAVSGPQMSSNQFLSAVRCVAYADVAGSGAELSEAKYRLNAEARRQSSDAATQAHVEVQVIARRAAAADPIVLRQEQTAACAHTQLAGGIDAGRA